LVETLTYAPLSFVLFFLAALAEIGGGYLVWLWIREKKPLALGILGGIILFVYGILPTLQPAEFGRVYAAYGGIFVLSSIIWGRVVDRKRPDRYEIIGSLVAVLALQLSSTLQIIDSGLVACLPSLLENRIFKSALKSTLVIAKTRPDKAGRLSGHVQRQAACSQRRRDRRHFAGSGAVGHAGDNRSRRRLVRPLLVSEI
jgi:small multidrug resistance family-3 protein